MAEITLTFDARNQIAKKTIDYILSIGVFTENQKNGLGKPATKLAIVKPRYNAATENAILEVKNGNTEKITLSQLRKLIHA